MGNFRIRKSSKRQDLYRIPDSLTTAALAMGIVQAAAVCAGLSGIFYRSLIPGAGAFPVFLYFYLKRKKKKQYRRRVLCFRGEFKELAEMLASFLLAGYSVENAMKKAYDSMNPKGDMTKMLGCMLTEIQMGESVENVWLHFSEQAPTDEIKDFGQIFALSKRSGASLPGVLQQVAGQLNMKVQTEMQIETQIAGKQMEQRIMNLMPAAILLYICVTSPEMMQVMYTTAVGRVVMTVCLGVYGGAFGMAEKMTESLQKKEGEG